jgi:hypothetical protein
MANPRFARSGQRPQQNYAAFSLSPTTPPGWSRPPRRPLRTPNTLPAIRFNFLSAALDREVTLEAMRITRRVMTAPAMAGIATDEIAPGVRRPRG